MKTSRALIWFICYDIFQYALHYRSTGPVLLLSASKLLSTQIKRPCFMVFLGRQEWYLLQDGKKHPFPDRYTKDVLRCKYINMTRSQINKAYVKGDAIKSLQVSAPNAALLLLLKNETGLVRDTYLLEPAVLNPSLVYRNGSAFLSGVWSKDSKFQRLLWVKNAQNVSNIQEIVKEKNFARDNLLQSIKFNGEDSRLFIARNDRMYLTFCRRFSKKIPELQMAYAEVVSWNDTFHMSPIVDVKFNEFPKGDQKNWCPFDFNGRMLFVSEIQPHRIVGLTSDPIDSLSPEQHVPSIMSTEAVTLSLTNITNTTWEYGEMRGGTPAVFIGEKRYLSFFHSSNDIIPGGTKVKTYNFGAYIFDSQPPFAVKAISRHPIVHRSMYSGPWVNNEQAFYLTDYVPFPMSFHVREGVVYLIYGKQDKAGWVAEMDLKHLLDSLRSVESETLSNIFK
jgi:predicted GH43/DUF377 family glycosyl hydrolase